MRLWKQNSKFILNKRLLYSNQLISCTWTRPKFLWTRPSWMVDASRKSYGRVRDFLQERSRVQIDASCRRPTSAWIFGGRAFRRGAFSASIARCVLCFGHMPIRTHLPQGLTCLGWLRDSIQDHSRNGPFTAALLHAANWMCIIHCSLGHHTWPPRPNCSS